MIEETSRCRFHGRPLHLAFFPVPFFTGNLSPISKTDVSSGWKASIFEKGLNPMQVASITGHKTLRMLKRYTHLKAED